MTAETDSLSPNVICALHADRVRQKRRSLFTASPLLLPALRRQMRKIRSRTLLLGIVAYAFIDNAAHAGGALTGAAIGFFTISRDGAAYRTTLDNAGWVATVILSAGGVFTVLRLTA